MKKISKKLIISLLIVLSLFNVYLQIEKNFCVYAMTETDEQYLDSESQGIGLGDIIDGVIGFFTWSYRVSIFIVAYVLKILIGLIAAIGGMNSSLDVRGIDIQNIIFSGASDVPGIDIVSIDFFNFNNTGTINSIRQNVAVWYFSLRNIAIVALLIILVYVGIRMVLSTVAEEEAKYKKMLKDWALSMVLLFTMHYIMIFTIEINKVLVNLIANGIETSNGWNSYTTELALDVFHVKATVGWGALIVYIMMIVVTLIYLVMYIKRMITVAFLIIISPLITITYSIDKMKDGKSQALDTWLKEFIYNVLIQPFHCIIYVVFVSTALRLIEDGGIGAVVLSVIMIAFMHKAEEIVKNIFGLKAQSMGSAIGSAAGVLTTMSLIQKAGGTGKGAPDPGKIPTMETPGKGGAQTTIPTSRTSGSPVSSEIAGNSQGTISGQQGSEGAGQGTRTTSTGAQGEVSVSSQSGGASEQNTVNSGSSEGMGEERPIISGPKVPKKKKAYSNFGASIINRLDNMTPADAARMAIAPAMYLMMGAMGLATGSFDGLRSGVYAASSINKGIRGLTDKSKANKAVERNENTFAAAYENFRNNHPEMTDAQAKAYTTSLLKGNLDKDISDQDYEYYSYVKGLGNTYSAVGEDDVEGRMMETIDMINSGEIGDYAQNRLNAGYGEPGEETPTTESSTTEASTTEQPTTESSATEEGQNMFQEEVERMKMTEESRMENMPITREEAYEYSNNLYNEGTISDEEHEKLLNEARKRPGDWDEATEYANELWEKGEISDDRHKEMMQEYKAKFLPESENKAEPKEAEPKKTEPKKAEPKETEQKEVGPKEKKS